MSSAGGAGPPRGSALRRFWHRGRVRVRAVRLWRSWRRSLRLRVVATTVVVGLVALVALGAYLSDRVRDTLYDQRRDAVLADAATQTLAAQTRFDTAPATTNAEVQQLASDAVRAGQSPGSGAVATQLLRSPSDDPITIIDVTSGVPIDISDELRAAVQDSREQRWQAVGLPGEDGRTEPGIAVGAPVQIPLAGEYEIYVVYSLAPEQDTLELIQRTLVIGAVVLIALLVAMTWYLTRQVLDPVQQAAHIAERLADGDLDERMRVRGDDELASLARTFNEMAESLQHQIERLAELSRVQQRFVSDVSHELRTPLTTIRMAAEILHANRDAFDAATRRSAELLHTQLDRFEEMLADLLEISRFDAGAALLDVEELDLRAVVRRVIDLAAPLAERKGSAVVVDEPDVECTADIDARRVERILRNLVVNAIEHGEGRPIEVTIGVNSRAVGVVVRDQGVGMTARETEHVFDRFWRADPARARTTGGTGLGLAISLEDARLHGGSLEAWGRPGEGAAFRLTLPRRSGLEIVASPVRLRPGSDADAPEDGARVDGRATRGPGTGSDPSAVPDLDEVTP